MKGEIGSAADPLTISDRHCRTCGCTDDRPCPPTCSWATDPLGLGDLCSRCLAIAASVTDVDLMDVGEFPMRFGPAGTLLEPLQPYDEDHGAWLLGGYALVALASVLVGLTIGVLIGRFTA